MKSFINDDAKFINEVHQALADLGINIPETGFLSDDIHEIIISNLSKRHSYDTVPSELRERIQQLITQLTTLTVAETLNDEMRQTINNASIGQGIAYGIGVDSQAISIEVSRLRMQAWNELWAAVGALQNCNS